ncbi:unnamed protein product [Hyaloperonospora brassicae]|uniref:FYVE-type domain-containing protein n=1 Tax=Hyaloperonospora brassicae TaxID=162125 RepID=A0AAV0V1A0_HYABA|nr:unnamed protein product [Hyaloperonospora brassicae]
MDSSSRDPRLRSSVLKRVASNLHSRCPLPADFFLPVTCAAEQHALFRAQADRLAADAAQKAAATAAGSCTTGADDWKLHNSQRHFRETGIRTASRRRDARDRDGHRQLEFCCVGRVEMPVEHCLDALYSDTTADFRSSSTFLVESVLDAVVLKALETRTDERPHHYLGLNWMASRSPGLFAKNRDLCYLRSMDMTVDSQQAKIGHVVIQSVDVAECSSLESALGLLRGTMSAVLLFKKNAESRWTDVWWQGSMRVTSSSSSSKLINFVHDTFTSIVCNLHKVQEAKYMAQQVKSQRIQRLGARERKRCYICSKKFSLVRVRSQCSACGENMCKDCEVASRARAFGSESFDLPTPTSRPDLVLFCKKCVSEAHCGMDGRPGLATTRANLSMFSCHDGSLTASAVEEGGHCGSTAGRTPNRSCRTTSTGSLHKIVANLGEGPAPFKGKRPGLASLYITAAIQMSSAGEVPMSPLSIRTEREKQRCRSESDPMESSDGLDKDKYGSLLQKDGHGSQERQRETCSSSSSSKYAASDRSHDARDNDMASRLRDISQRAQEALDVTKRNSHMMSSDTSSAPRVSDLAAFKELDRSIAEQADLLNAIGFVSTGRVYMESAGYDQGGVRISASSSTMSEDERFEVIA